jgi:hypothetical protein
MQCENCGLQWTMTYYQLAKAARHWAQTEPDKSGLTGELAEGLAALAQYAGERVQARVPDS